MGDLAPSLVCGPSYGVFWGYLAAPWPWAPPPWPWGGAGYPPPWPVQVDTYTLGSGVPPLGER